jgi:hypothetical protein
MTNKIEVSSPDKGSFLITDASYLFSASFTLTLSAVAAALCIVLRVTLLASLTTACFVSIFASYQLYLIKMGHMKMAH